MRRVLFNLALVVAVVGLAGWAWSKVRAAPSVATHSQVFDAPYLASQPLESFLVFQGAPQANIPDGQIHWVDSEVPGIDTLGPDGVVRNMCPDDGLAWTLAGGDPYGGGTFVAVECQGRAAGWQMLAFHLCRVDIPASADSNARVYTHVSPGSVVGWECGGHTHLSLGYWAARTDQQALPCPQWWVQGRYWVNAACLLKSQGLSASVARRLAPAEDWELRYLKPEILDPLRRLALFLVSLGGLAYLIIAFLRPPASADPEARYSPAFEATVKSVIGGGLLVFLILLSAGPFWPVSSVRLSRFTADERRYQAVAKAVGYEDWELLQAFYAAAVPRLATGQPAETAEAGKVFPPEAAAAIPFGETDAAPWGEVDPTRPGVYGRSLAWDAVAERWPPDLYEKLILRLSVSRQAQAQRQGLEAIAQSADMQALGRKLGKTIRAQDLYGSTAGAVGRTQILPGHFSPGGVCGDMISRDVWNNPAAVAECTTRYLTTSGCWGSWWNTNDVWSALCGYNPGAWNQSADQWYWNVLQDRMTRLSAASAEFDLGQPVNGTVQTLPVGQEKYVSTPVLGLLITQAFLQDGQSNYVLPGPLNTALRTLSPYLSDYHPEVRVLYRLFRAWLLIYYSPADLLMFGIAL
jgi:hypothetical protein